jgi:hypothetical protein
MTKYLVVPEPITTDELNMWRVRDMLQIADSPDLAVKQAKEKRSVGYLARVFDLSDGQLFRTETRCETTVTAA